MAKNDDIEKIIDNASKFFGRPITIIDKDENSIKIKGENGIKKEELLDYILSNKKKAQIKEDYIEIKNILQKDEYML